jgi:serine protease Do
MSNRARTIASFFSIAMAAMLLGAAVTTQVRTENASPRTVGITAASASVPRAQGPITLDTFRDIARQETPGVVNISSSKVVRSRDSFRDFFGDDLLDRFFRPAPRGRSETLRSLGSGFVIDRDGHILTNRHVIEGAEQIQVTLANGRTYPAKVVGKDARTDVAVVRIEPKESLTVVSLGDSDQTEVGEWVMAIGNPFGLWQNGTVGGPSVTVGVVSYKGRGINLGQEGTSVDMIQTDAAINPGNSGGPLVNTRGEVIGINTLIITQGSPASSGVGFAVPINVAKEILPQLQQKGKVTRGWLGVSIDRVTENTARSYGLKETGGAVINEVTPGSPADKAGVQPEDLVVAVDGHPIQDNGDLSRYIGQQAPGKTVRLQIVRRDRGQRAERTVAVTLGTFPEENASGNDEGDSSGGGDGSPQLGMTLRPLTPDMASRLDLPRGVRGVMVMDVEAGTSAEEAGLQRGDVIVTVNGTPVEEVADFQREIAKAKGDGVARVRARRGSRYYIATLRLGD